jgi:hypothetical protein
MRAENFAHRPRSRPDRAGANACVAHLACAALVAVVVGCVVGRPTAAQAEVGRGRLDSSLAAFAAAGGVDYRGEVRLRWRLLDHLDVAVAGRAGLLRVALDDRFGPGTAGASHAEADQFVLALGVGPMWSSGARVDGWELYGGVLLAHVHHARLPSWQRTPLANLAGDSAGSVRHRSGIEALFGFSPAPLTRLGDYALLAGAELGAGVLPSSQELSWSAGLRLTLGLRDDGPRVR